MNPDDPKIKAWLKRPADMAYYGELPLFETWTLGPTIETRDSDLLEVSNAAEIKRLLEDRTDLEGMWEITQLSHWAVGWVDHLAFRVLNDDGTVNEPMVEFWMEIEEKLSDYPVLDEDDYSTRQFESFAENVENQTQYVLRDYVLEYSEELFSKIWEYFMNKNIDTGGDDGNGYYPSEEEIEEALKSLGYEKETA